jgi:3-hydroxyisobutyrate dehydrogenase
MTMSQQTIGWIGTGVMGKPMCMHLLDDGHTLFVHNRTPDKAAPLIDRGARWCSTPAEVASQCDIVFSMVGYPRDVEEIVLGEAGVTPHAREGTIIVDMTTSTPTLAIEIHRRAREKGLYALDAPVSGGDVGAREARLAIMVGGDRDTFDRVLPLFQLLGKTIAYMGGPGAGQHTKLANQISIASTMIGVVESLQYAYKAGLDLESVIDVIGTGAAGSWSLNNLGRRIVQGDFKPGFFIKHFLKDMEIALTEAARMELDLPGLSIAYQFYMAASSMGYEDLGTQALYKVFENMNNLNPHVKPSRRNS